MSERAPWVRVLADIAELRARLDQLEHDSITLVREAGATWEDIGDELGISRQAARERFTKPRRWRRRGES